MPKIAGVSVLAIVSAAATMYFIGFVVFGVLFGNVFMASRGLTEADFEGSNPAYMAGGFLIELVLAFAQEFW